MTTITVYPWDLREIDFPLQLAEYGYTERIPCLWNGENVDDVAFCEIVDEHLGGFNAEYAVSLDPTEHTLLVGKPLPATEVEKDEIVNAFLSMDTNKEPILNFVRQYGLFVPFTPLSLQDETGSPFAALIEVEGISKHFHKEVSPEYLGAVYRNRETLASSTFRTKWLYFFEAFRVWQEAAVWVDDQIHARTGSKEVAEMLDILIKSCVDSELETIRGGRVVQTESTWKALPGCAGIVGIVEHLTRKLERLSTEYMETQAMNLLGEYRNIDQNIAQNEAWAQGENIPVTPRFGNPHQDDDDPKILEELQNTQFTEKAQELIRQLQRELVPKDVNALRSVLTNRGMDVRLTITEQDAHAIELWRTRAQNTADKLIEKRDAISKALDYVEHESHKYYQLLQLQYIQGKSKDEVLDEMGISPKEHRNWRKQALTLFIERCPVEYLQSSNQNRKRGPKVNANT